MSMVPLEYYTIAIMLFLLSILGMVINRNHLMLMMMCVELMLLATSLLFLVCSYALTSPIGEMFTISMIAIAAAESAMGLAIIVAFFRISGTIAVKAMSLLSG